MTESEILKKVDPEVERLLKSVTVEELKRVVDELEELGEDTSAMRHAVEELEDVESYLQKKGESHT